MAATVVTTVAARETELGELVEVVASLAHLLALRHRGGALALRHPLLVLDDRALVARQTSGLRVVLPDWTFRALLAPSQVVVGAGRARHALLVDDHLTILAAVVLLEDDAAWVEEGSRKRVDLLVLGRRRKNQIKPIFINMRYF